MERNLQNVANYLILSLAVADLLVAVLVMPLGAVYEVGSFRINYIVNKPQLHNRYLSLSSVKTFEYRYELSPSVISTKIHPNC